MQKEAAGLIRNIFRYMDKDAKDIMTHRKNIVAIDGDRNTGRGICSSCWDETLFPTSRSIEEDIDQIIGIIHLREAATGYLDEVSSENVR